MKNVVIITPGFFHLDDMLREGFEALGHSVTQVTERPDGVVAKALIRLDIPFLSAWFRRLRLRQILKSIPENDLLVYFNPELPTKRDLSALYQKSKALRFYFWDSTKIKKRFLDIISDKNSNIFTFDRVDAEKFGLTYQSLFYSKPDILPDAVKATQQVFFAGTLYGSRLNKLTCASQLLSERQIKLKTHLYCKTPLHWLWYQWQARSKGADFCITTKKFSRQELQQAMVSSFAVLDFAESDQNGMSLRTFEAIAHSCKIVTDNSQTLREFSDDENVIELSRLVCKEAAASFFSNSFKQKPHYEKYELSEFVKVLTR